MDAALHRLSREQKPSSARRDRSRAIPDPPRGAPQGELRHAEPGAAGAALPLPPGARDRAPVARQHHARHDREAAAGGFEPRGGALAAVTAKGGSVARRESPLRQRTASHGGPAPADQGSRARARRAHRAGSQGIQGPGHHAARIARCAAASAPGATSGVVRGRAAPAAAGRLAAARARAEVSARGHAVGLAVSFPLGHALPRSVRRGTGAPSPA